MRFCKGLYFNIILMYLSNQSSVYQPYKSLGSLSMVSLSQIRQEQNLDYLQNLCGFIDEMNLNPLWYESQTTTNKLKLLEIYQMAINYSKNLSHAYQKEIDNLQVKNTILKQQNQDRQKRIRQHKEKVEKHKEKYKMKKHKIYKVVYGKLKRKLKEDEKEHYRQERYSESSADQPQIVYVPMPPPTNYNPYPNQMPHHPFEAPYSDPHYRTPPPPPPPPQPPHPQNFQRPPISYQIPPNPQNSNAIKQNMGPGQEFIAKQFANYFSQSGRNNDQISQPSQPKPNSFDKNSNSSMNPKKTEKSFILEKHQEPQNVQMDYSVITGQVTVSKVAEINIDPIIESKTSKIKQKISIGNKKDEERDFERPLQEHHSSKQAHSNSVDQQQFDSIANIKFNNESKITNGKQAFQSKIVPKQPKPSFLQSNDQFDQIGLSLRGESNIQKKQSNQQQEPMKTSVLKRSQQIQKLNIQNTGSEIKYSMSKVSKFSKDNQEDSAVKLFSDPSTLERASKNDKNNKPLQNKKQEKEGYGGDLEGIELNGVSNIAEKKAKVEDFGQLNNSIRGKKQADKGSKASDPADKAEKLFSGENLLRKSKQSKNKQENKLQKKEDPSLIRGSVSTPIQHKQRPGSNIQVISQHIGKKIKDDYGDISDSNFGQKSGISKSNQTEKLFSGQSIDRHSKLHPTHEMGSAGNFKPKQDKISEHEEEDNYDDDFQIDGVDPNKLMISHQPASKQPNINPKPSGLFIPQIPLPRSNINIIVSQSSKEQSQLSKYCKLKNEEFKIKDIKKSSRINESNRMMQDNQDFFDFIPSMPANSVIAKRPVPVSKIVQKEKGLKEPSSLSIPSVQNLPTNTNFSINLISPSNVASKLLGTNRGQREISDQNSKAQNNNAQQGLRQSNLPIALGAELVSKVISGKNTNLLSMKNQQQNEKPVNAGSAVNNKSDSELQQLQLEEDSKIEEKTPIAEIRKKILMMVKKLPQAELSKFDNSKFQANLINETLKNVGKSTFDELDSLEKIKKCKQILEEQTKKVKGDGEKRKKTVDEVFKKENISLDTPPKLQSALQSDSLDYSYSQFKQPSKQPSKKSEKKTFKVVKDLTQSIQFSDELVNNSSFQHPQNIIDNPYTPDGLEKQKANKPNPPQSFMSNISNNPYIPSQKKEKPVDKGQQQKKETKSNNKFLLSGNRAAGTKEKDSLFKAAGEGILKFDIDDPLNAQIIDLYKQKTKTPADFDDDFS